MVRRSTKTAAGSDAGNDNVAAAKNANSVNGQRDIAATEAPPEKPAPVKTKPNIKLAAQADPLGAGKLTVGMDVIGELPNAETQKAGWHCTFARRLVQLFPDRFKLIIEKGN